jgi:2-C-methyl-D-erythritol 2,4-cyclodiphosphate synthase
MRVGFGYDSHRFEPSRSLVLGGVTIPDAPGLAGHSDADAVCHAVTDALLGAAAAGDIGQHFPPDADRWKDADSLELLRRAVRIVADRDVHPVNVDVTVVCERPTLAPHSRAMRQKISSALDLSVGAVSLKAKTNEGMGWIGAGEGIAVFAVALLAPGGGDGSRGGYVGSTEGFPI